MPELTPELIVDRILPRDPRISPSGDHVAWVAAPASRREEHPVATIWLGYVGRAGDPPRASLPLTGGQSDDHTPRWSPDGRYLYFLSDRARRGTAQLYRLAVAGGEAEPLTTGPAPVAGFAVAPDGRTLAFTGPDETSEDDERRERERDDAQVWGERVKRHRLRLLDLASGQVRTVDLGERHVAGLTWAPTGRAIAVALWPGPALNYAWHGAEILVVSVDGAAEPRELGRHVCAGDSLTFAGAGQYLLYLGPEAGHQPSSHAVWRLDLSSGEARCLSTGLDGCVLGIACDPEAPATLLLVAEGTTSSLLWLDADTGELTDSYRPPGRLIEAVDTRAGLCATVESAWDSPPEVVAGSLNSPAARQLSRHGAPFDGVSFGQQTELRWTAPDGWAIDGLLVTPPGRLDHPCPLICYVHGGPYGRFANGFNVTWAQWLAAQGWAVLMPNPRGGLGHGHRFADTVAGEIGNADYHDIMAGVDALVERGVADRERLAIGGWSQGGFMTAWAIGQTSRFRAGVMGAGVSDWGMMTAESDMTDFELMLGGDAPWDGIGPHRHQRQSPISYARNVKTPLLILHGEKDERVPVSQGRLMGMALRRLGVPVEEVVYPREPHGLRERHHQLDLLHRIAAWYRRWL